jgi:hypothetical protein
MAFWDDSWGRHLGRVLGDLPHSISQRFDVAYLYSRANYFALKTLFPFKFRRLQGKFSSNKFT